ncbi:MAG: hypothetical protein IT519_00995 [Burkholderiales bacterium]|nr:hypothetical protein [Burkholderiales bacterium]MCE7877865.1 hypothetical protein [Betaproteobacteria bacterium PRO3]
MVEVLARVLVAHPLHVFAVALVHFGFWAGIGMTAMRGSPTGNVMWVPALLWLAYAAWEWLVGAVTPEANIRVDLLLIWPLIAIVTLWAVIRTTIAWRSARRRGKTRR